MNEYTKSLEELCETLSKEIKKANSKIEKANGELTAGDIEYIDKLTHALKSVKTTMAMMESEQYSNRGSYADGNRGSYDGGSYGRYSRDGGTYRGSYDSRSYDDGSYDRSYDDGRSYARGRGRYAKRDSMGRYASDGYSRHGDMMSELYELMQDTPDERTRQEIQRLIDKMDA